jgi:hypothetical protein
VFGELRRADVSRSDAERSIEDAVKHARERGYSWAFIGSLVGTSIWVATWLAFYFCCGIKHSRLGDYRRGRSAAARSPAVSVLVGYSPEARDLGGLALAAMLAQSHANFAGKFGRLFFHRPSSGASCRDRWETLSPAPVDGAGRRPVRGTRSRAIGHQAVTPGTFPVGTFGPMPLFSSKS